MCVCVFCFCPCFSSRFESRVSIAVPVTWKRCWAVSSSRLLDIAEQTLTLRRKYPSDAVPVFSLHVDVQGVIVSRVEHGRPAPRSLFFSLFCVLVQPRDNIKVEVLPAPNRSSHACLLQLTLLSNFASNFHAAVDGRGSSPEGIEMNELYGGARIRCLQCWISSWH